MSASAILLTGATGFIGREVARRLLAAGRPVVALARGKEDEPAPDRVAQALGFAPDGARLDVVEGDLSLPGCGLGESDWRRLRANVETVIHCAGETTFFPEDMASFRQGHIDGPLDLLHGLRGGRLRRWGHLSTAYVCGKRTGRVLEREGDLGQEFHNPYERVKLEAEIALRRGARLGLDVRVLRPSIVVGAAPATTGATPSNLFFDFIRMAARLARLADGAPVPLRIEAAPGAPFNLVPVEYVATAVVALAEHPRGAGETVHLVVSDPPTPRGDAGYHHGPPGPPGAFAGGPARRPAPGSLAPRGDGYPDALGLSRLPGAGRPLRRHHRPGAVGRLRRPAGDALPRGHPPADRPGPGGAEGLNFTKI